MKQSDILLLSLFVAVPCSSVPQCQNEIELDPPVLVVEYGSSVSVKCIASKPDFSPLGWEAPIGGTGLRLESPVVWEVENLTDWDISPLCFYGKGEEQCEKQLDVTLYRFPETININSKIKSEDLKIEGEAYEFTCDVIDIAPVQNLKVRWYYNNQLNTSETFNKGKEPSNQTSVLSYVPSRSDHNSNIRCEASMDLGPVGPRFHVSSQNFTIQVAYGPEQTCPDSLLVPENSPVSCSRGFPAPSEIWYKDGEEVDRKRSLTRDDSGLYQVAASSDYSRIDFTVNITVLFGPEQTCRDTFIVAENSPRISPCSQGSPPPQETWYLDGEEVVLPEILTRQESGMYLVNSSNSNSWINFTINIIVLYPPSPIEELENSEVQVGNTLRLKCSSKGNPTPGYSWTYFNMPNVKIIQEDGVSFLIIYNATGDNAGSYTCSSSNEEGHVNKTVKVTVRGADPGCPINLTPDKLVLEYQSGTEPISCTSTSTDSSNVKKIYWKTRNLTIQDSIWRPDTHSDWDPKPACYAKFVGRESCRTDFKFTLYKTPDGVSVRAVNGSTSAVEGSELNLQCDVYNVAPARNLSVRWLWYQGNDTNQPVKEFDAQCTSTPVRSPVNVSCFMTLTLNRTLNPMKVQCEAQLDLRPDGDQLPKMKSDLLNFDVLYKPTINVTKLPGIVPVFRGYPEELVCQADGNPPPNITWLFSSNTARPGPAGKLRVFEAGVYNCTATNFNSTVRTVTVVLEEDYQPLIAGFVAVVVVAISVIFLFIYSIYYKNTKMRRYNFKNPKLSTHNGNVAHNGWDLQFPMTKLS